MEMRVYFTEMFASYECFCIRVSLLAHPPRRSIMKKLIAVLTIVTLIAVPTFVQSVSAAPVSPSSSCSVVTATDGSYCFDFPGCRTARAHGASNG